MRYEQARNIVWRHINYIAGAVQGAEEDLNRPAEHRTEHILILLELAKRHICDDLYNLERQEDLEEIAKLDKMAVDMEGEE